MNNTYHNIHNQSKYYQILHNISDVYIPIDTSWKNIGVTLSGGADSAILTYIVCLLIEKLKMDVTIHVIYNIRMWKTRPWQSYISKNVYNYFVSKFNTLNFVRHENFVPPQLEWGNIGPSIPDENGNLTSGDILELKSFGEYICHKFNIDVGFLGVNKNPSIIIPGSLNERDVDIQDLTIDNFIIKRQNTLICHPFRILEKDKIISLYHELNVLDLLSLTWSCEGDLNSYPNVFNGLDYTTYVEGQHVPECGECFWCNERKWGIENAKK